MSGNLPRGWAFVRLGDLGMGRVDNINPAEQPNIEFESWSVPVFPTGKPEIVLGSSIGSNKQRVQEGDVLLCKINPRINRVWRVGQKSGRPQIGSTEWIVFRSSSFDPDFLMWRFRESSFRLTLATTVAGVGGSLMRARPQDVANLEIALPPLAEQRRIVARLEKLEARSRRARAALDSIPAQLAQARQSLLAAAFRGELTADWRVTNRKSLRHKERSPTQDTAVSRPLPTGWLATKLRNIVPREGLFDGPFGSHLKSDDYTSNGVRVVRLENIGHLTFDDQKRTFISEAKHKLLQRHTVTKGDIIFSSFIFDPPRACLLPVIDTPAIAKADCFCIRPLAQSVDRNYLCYQLASPNFGHELKDMIHGVTRPRVNTTQLREAPIVWCPLIEQREIVRRLERALARLDAAAAAQRAAVAELDRLDQALLAQAFSGKLVKQGHF